MSGGHAWAPSNIAHRDAETGGRTHLCPAASTSHHRGRAESAGVHPGERARASACPTARTLPPSDTVNGARLHAVDRSLRAADPGRYRARLRRAERQLRDARRRRAGARGRRAEAVNRRAAGDGRRPARTSRAARRVRPGHERGTRPCSRSGSSRPPDTITPTRPPASSGAHWATARAIAVGAIDVAVAVVVGVVEAVLGGRSGGTSPSGAAASRAAGDRRPSPPRPPLERSADAAARRRRPAAPPARPFPPRRPASPPRRPRRRSPAGRRPHP